MKITILLALFVSGGLLFGQAWEISGNTALDMNQNYYSDNWDGSESGSVNWSASVDMTANRQFTKKFLNKNSLKLEFGQTHSQDKESGNWGKPQKTTDNITLESLGIFTLASFANPFVGLKFESQFIEEYDPDKHYSGTGATEFGEDGDDIILNDKILTESFGLSKVVLKNDNSELSSRFGGAFKQILNARSQIKNTNNGGVEMIIDYKLDFSAKNATFTSYINLYKAMYNSATDDLKGEESEDYWKKVDIDWQNSLVFKVTSYLNIKFSTQLLYDREIHYAGRFKQNSSLGT